MRLRQVGVERGGRLETGSSLVVVLLHQVYVAEVHLEQRRLWCQLSRQVALLQRVVEAPQGHEGGAVIVAAVRVVRVDLYRPLVIGQRLLVAPQVVEQDRVGVKRAPVVGGEPQRSLQHLFGVIVHAQIVQHVAELVKHVGVARHQRGGDLEADGAFLQESPALERLCEGQHQIGHGGNAHRGVIQHRLEKLGGNDPGDAFPRGGDALAYGAQVARRLRDAPLPRHDAGGEEGREVVLRGLLGKLHVRCESPVQIVMQQRQRGHEVGALGKRGVVTLAPGPLRPVPCAPSVSPFSLPPKNLLKKPILVRCNHSAGLFTT